MAIYITYTNGVLIWFILGAVLNPNRFLQYASAITTLYLFIATKIQQLNQTQDTLHTSLVGYVQQQVQLTLQRNMDEINPIPIIQTEDLAQKKKQLMTVIHTHLGLPVSISPQSVHNFSLNKWGAMFALIASVKGIPPGILRGIVGSLKGNQLEILHQLNKLNNSLDLHLDFIGKLCELSLLKLKPKDLQLQKGKAFILLKDLFRENLKDLPLILIDLCIEFFFFNNPAGIIDLFSKVSGFPIELLRMMFHILESNDGNLGIEASNFMQRILGQDQLKVLQILTTFSEDTKFKQKGLIDLPDLSPSLKLEHFLSTKSERPHLRREGLLQFLKVLEEQESGFFRDQSLINDQKMLLGLMSIAHNSEMDTQLIIDQLNSQSIKINPDRINILRRVMEGDPNTLRQICCLLQVSSSFDLIQEFFAVVNSKSTEFYHTIDRLNFRKIEAKPVLLIILLLKNIQLINAVALSLKGEYEENLRQNIWPKSQIKYFLSEIKYELTESLRLLLKLGIVSDKIESKGGKAEEELKDLFLKREARQGSSDQYLYQLLASIFSLNPTMVICSILKSKKLSISDSQWNQLILYSRIVIKASDFKVPQEVIPYISQASSQSDESQFATYLGVGKAQCSFLLSIISRDYFKVFSVNQELSSKENLLFEQSLQNHQYLAKILDIPLAQIKTVASLWLEQVDLIDKSKEGLLLLNDKFKISPLYFSCLKNCQSNDPFTNREKRTTFLRKIRRLIQTSIKDKEGSEPGSMPSQIPLIARSSLSNLQDQKQFSKLFKIGFYLCDIQAPRISCFQKLGLNFQFSIIMSHLVKYTQHRNHKHLGHLIEALSNYLCTPSLSQDEKQNLIMVLQMSLILSLSQFNRSLGFQGKIEAKHFIKNIEEKITTLSQCTIKIYENCNQCNEDHFQRNYEVESHDLHFSRLISHKIAKFLNIPEHSSIIQGALSVMIAHSTEDRECLQKTLSSFLLQNYNVRHDLSEGFCCLVDSTIKNEQDIRSFCTLTNLDTRTVFHLKGLQSKDSCQINEAIYELCLQAGHVKDFTLIASLVGAFKGDLSCIPSLLQKARLPYSSIGCEALALGMKQTSKISRCSSEIASILQIKSIQSINILLKLLDGDTSVVKFLSNKLSFSYKLKKPEVAEALIFILSTGRKIRNYCNEFNYDHLNIHLQALVNAIQITEGLPLIEITQQLQTKRSRQKIHQNISLLIEAVWGNQNALSLLANQIGSTSSNKIWSSVLSQNKKTLKELFQFMYWSLLEEKVRISKQVETRFENFNLYAHKLSQIKPDLKAVVPVPQQLLTYTPEVNEQISNAPTLIEQSALTLGCSALISETISFIQPAFKCRTCSGSEDNSLVCLCCANICHKGHLVEKIVDLKDIKFVCDCKKENQVLEREVCISQFECTFNQQIFLEQEKQRKFKSRKAFIPKLRSLTIKIPEDLNFSQIEEQEQEQITGENFTLKNFLVDLDKALGFSREYQSSLIWDNTLNRNISLVQLLIFLAQGNYFTSLNQFLVSGQNQKEYLTVSSIVGFAEGDFAKIQNYGRVITQALNIQSGLTPSRYQSLKAIALLKRGLSNQELIRLYEGKQQPSIWFKQIFQQIFREEWRNGLALHSLITLRQREIVAALSNVIAYQEQALISEISQIGSRIEFTKSLRNLLQQVVLKDVLKLNETSLGLTNQFLLLSFGQIPAEFTKIVGRENIRAYEAIVKPSSQNVQELVTSIQKQFPTDLAISLWRLMVGEESQVTNLIINTLDSIPQEETLSSLLSALGRVSAGKTYQIEYDLQLICEALQIEESSQNILKGLAGIITRNCQLSTKLFQYDWENLDEQLATSILNLVTENWQNKDIQIISKQICNSPGSDEWKLNETELHFLSQLVRALEGDLDSLAHTVDLILFGKKISFCSILCSLARNRISDYHGDIEEHSQFEQQALHSQFQQEVHSLFSSFLKTLYTHQNSQKLAYVPRFLFTAVSSDLEFVSKVFDPLQQFKPPQMERKTFKKLLTLRSSSSSVIDFDSIFDQISHFVSFNQQVTLMFWDSSLPQDKLINPRDIGDILKQLQISQEDVQKSLCIYFTEEGVTLKFSKLLELVYTVKDQNGKFFKFLLILIHSLLLHSPSVSQVLSYFHQRLRNSSGPIIQEIKNLLKIANELVHPSYLSIKSILSQELINCTSQWLLSVFQLWKLDSCDFNKVRILVYNIITSFLPLREAIPPPPKVPVSLAVEALTGSICFCKFGVKGIQPLAQLFGTFDLEQVSSLVKILNEYKELIQCETECELPLIAPQRKKWNFMKLFQALDVNKNRSIDFYQFSAIGKHLGLFINKELLLRMFAFADQSGKNELDLHGFDIALSILHQDISNQALVVMGLSTADLLYFLVVSVLFLLLLFVFIFVGISVFSSNNTFSSVINSALPALAGVSLSLKKENHDKVMQSLKSAVRRILKSLAL